MNAPAPKPAAYTTLTPGDPAPWFHQRSTSNPRYAFHTTAGRYIVLCFFASASEPRARSALDAVRTNRGHFDDHKACFFGISIDLRDETDGRVSESMPGIRFFWDFDGAVSRLYGSIPKDAKPSDGPISARQFWLVIDPTLRVMASFPFGNDAGHDALFEYLDSLPAPDRFAGFEIQAPVLVLPNVIELELCLHLISLYQAHGGEELGFMRDIDGKTVPIHDHQHKRRRDYTIEDRDLIKQIHTRIQRRINPEITKVHCFKPTRIERNIVSCYAAEDNAHFRAHRDNTTRGQRTDASQSP